MLVNCNGRTNAERSAATSIFELGESKCCSRNWSEVNASGMSLLPTSTSTQFRVGGSLYGKTFPVTAATPSQILMSLCHTRNSIGHHQTIQQPQMASTKWPQQSSYCPNLINATTRPPMSSHRNERRGLPRVSN